MARKIPEVNDHQGQLLREVQGMGVLAVANFPDDPVDKLMGHAFEQQVLYGMPGAYVELLPRANHLIAALMNLGYRNQRLGFDLASNTRQYSKPIWAEYRSRTPTVQEGAAANADKFLQKAKLSFWKATGYSALRKLNLAPRDELDAGARKMWREFSAAYEPPSKRKARDGYKRTLRRSAKTSRKIIGQLEMAT